jgi:hypothetical protein
VQDSSFNDRSLPPTEDIEASLKLKSINLSNFDSSKHLQANEDIVKKDST